MILKIGKTYKFKTKSGKITIKRHINDEIYESTYGTWVIPEQLIIPTHGGKRPGAGRPKGILKKQQCIYLPETLIQKAEKISKINNIKKNKIYETAIQQYLDLI